MTTASRIRAGLTHYFDNPWMVKVRNDEDQGLTLYAARATTLLNEERYLLVMTPMDLHLIGTRRPMASLDWSCLQTRVLQAPSPQERLAPAFVYEPKQDHPLYDAVLRLESRDRKRTCYECPAFPALTVVLLHKKDLEYEYPPQGRLNSAVETYSAVLLLDDQK